MAKRIAMVSYHTCPLASEEGKETGGMNVYVLELSKQLGKHGIYVDIFTRGHDVGHPQIVHVTPKVRVIHILAGPQRGVRKKLLKHHITEFSLNLKEFIEKEQQTYDVVHCHYYLSGLIGLRMQEYLGKLPIVISFHTLALMKNLVARDELEREDDERIQAEMMLTNRTNHIIATSKTDKEYLRYLYECDTNKISVIYPGVDADIFKPSNQLTARKQLGINLKQKHILFVGRIEPLKGIDMLIYAIKIICEKATLDNICVWIVGGDVSDKKRRWSKELQRLDNVRNILELKASVRFVGQQKQHVLPIYYNAADLVVIPSHYESFGMAALEAMACGTPVITTNATGISTLLDDDQEKYVTSVNNPMLLASQIERLLQNKKDRLEFSKDAFKTARKLTWNGVAMKMMQIYNDVYPGR